MGDDLILVSVATERYLVRRGEWSGEGEEWGMGGRGGSGRVGREKWVGE